MRSPAGMQASSPTRNSRLGVTVKRVMTDNGPCYTSHAFAATCKQFGLKHIRTKPYTPRTNGKAERFIQTALREWAYARAYQTSKQRAQDLPLWTHSYNWHRPHSGIKQLTPVGQLKLNQNNLLRFHTQESEQTLQELHARIGQLIMENDFLERGFTRISGPRGKNWCTAKTPCPSLANAPCWIFPALRSTTGHHRPRTATLR